MLLAEALKKKPNHTPVLLRMAQLSEASGKPAGRPGLQGMFTGFVDRHWARHHYHHWYQEHFETEAVPPSAEEDRSTS